MQVTLILYAVYLDKNCCDGNVLANFTMPAKKKKKWRKPGNIRYPYKIHCDDDVHQQNKTKLLCRKYNYKCEKCSRINCIKNFLFSVFFHNSVIHGNVFASLFFGVEHFLKAYIRHANTMLSLVILMKKMRCTFEIGEFC